MLNGDALAEGCPPLGCLLRVAELEQEVFLLVDSE